MSKLDESHVNFRAAQARHFDEVAKALPAGAEVMWKHHDAIQYGTVISTTRDQAMVRNHNTGTERLMYAFWFTQAHGGAVISTPAAKAA